MTPIPVRAHSAIGIGHLILAVGILVAAMVYTDVLAGVVALLNLWLAYSWTFTPTIALFPNKVETYNRLGQVRRKTYFSGLEQLELRGRQLYMPDNQLPVADATLGRAQDWQRVVQAIEAARAKAGSVGE